MDFERLGSVDGGLHVSRPIGVPDSRCLGTPVWPIGGTIRFEHQNQHRAMLHVAIREGYDLIDIRWDTATANNVAIFEKDLRQDVPRHGPHGPDMRLVGPVGNVRVFASRGRVSYDSQVGFRTPRSWRRLVEKPSLSLTDLCQHSVTFGMDIYPPIEIPQERTRLNMFYEEASQRWNGLFDRLVTSDTEFRISKKFQKSPEVAAPSYSIDTFVLTNRGPVFVFPLLLDEPVGDTGLEETCLDRFKEIHELFFQAIPNRRIMRVGLIRDLIFNTGSAPCQELIAEQTSFAEAKLMGGKAVFKYRDQKHNHNILVEPMSRVRTTQLAAGPTVNEPAGYGVHVQLDVNNSVMQRALEESDIQEVIDRATSLWPDKLLEYIEGLSKGRRT